MDEESFIRLVNSQTQALTQVAMISTSTKEVLERVVENQAAQTKMMQSCVAAAEEFRSRTFKLLVGIIIFLVLVVSGLMVKLNIEGGDVLGDSTKKVISGGVRGRR